MDADRIRTPGLSQRGLEVLNGVPRNKWGTIPGAKDIGGLNPAVGQVLGQHLARQLR
jgi:hypothetical protein